MTTTDYMAGRKRYARPHAMLWSDTPGTLSNGIYIPSGYEVNSDQTGITSDDSFIILSDHNRKELNMATQRIEQRKRMANGTMRSYHIADKRTLTTSWQMLPSRSYKLNANFNQTTGKSGYDHGYGSVVGSESEFTSDGGAGGVEMLDWYENHTGPFWVFLSYDKYNNFGTDNNAHLHLAEYNQVLQMYITNFDYSVVKRGGTNMDLWNINVSLEEA
jgi:hypothetical protein